MNAWKEKENSTDKLLKIANRQLYFFLSSAFEIAKINSINRSLSHCRFVNMKKETHVVVTVECEDRGKLITKEIKQINRYTICTVTAVYILHTNVGCFHFNLPCYQNSTAEQVVMGCVSKKQRVWRFLFVCFKCVSSNSNVRCEHHLRYSVCSSDWAYNVTGCVLETARHLHTVYEWNKRLELNSVRDKLCTRCAFFYSGQVHQINLWLIIFFVFSVISITTTS